MLASVYLTVGTSIIAFTLVILFLVMALLFAQSKLIHELKFIKKKKGRNILIINYIYFLF